MGRTLLSRLGELNPQLFRELKGRLTPAKLSVAAAISLGGQLLLYAFLQARLSVDSFCATSSPALRYRDADIGGRAGQTASESAINWPLWWLDAFVALSAIGMGALLVVSTYMLVADLAREERRGTLAFVRHSPQSATTVLVGKLLGVPVLLYVAVLLALPLHLGAGMAAQLPLGPIFGFYVALAASCAFFYSAALLWGLVGARWGHLPIWLGSGAVLLYWGTATANLLDLDAASVFPLVTATPLDWLQLFYPGFALPYAVSEAPHSLETIGYLNIKDWAQLQWFGQLFWQAPARGIGFMLANYAIGTVAIWSALKRRFDTPERPLASKPQSYGIVGAFTLGALGFAVQMPGLEYRPVASFAMLFGLELLLFLGLIAALTPHRPTLQAWLRARASRTRRPLAVALLWDDGSPAVGAIALGLAIASAAIGGSALLLPLEGSRPVVLVGWFVTAGTILLAATLVQGLLLLRTRQRSRWATGAIAALVVLPVASRVVGGPTALALLLFPMPAIGAAPTITVFWTILGQWTAIVLLNLGTVQQLKRAERSEFAALQAERNAA
ncbi:MAG: hypothetical protein BRC58_08440 [Cyanobacteria bacterium QS_8_64_29]|nr:MAG: hypothetical protein BRC58_08440 [Cyanobacteria bacterium QS_8_64_29]